MLSATFRGEFFEVTFPHDGVPEEKKKQIQSTIHDIIARVRRYESFYPFSEKKNGENIIFTFRSNDVALHWTDVCRKELSWISDFN